MYFGCVFSNVLRFLLRSLGVVERTVDFCRYYSALSKGLLDVGCLLEVSTRFGSFLDAQVRFSDRCAFLWGLVGFLVAEAEALVRSAGNQVKPTKT